MCRKKGICLGKVWIFLLAIVFVAGGVSAARAATGIFDRNGYFPPLSDTNNFDERNNGGTSGTVTGTALYGGSEATGTLSLSKDEAYLSGDTVVATVVDDDRNTNSAAEDTLTTALKLTGSNYYIGTADLLMNLVESGINTGTFLATITTGAETFGGGTDSNNGTVKARQGCTVNVIYTDTTPSASSVIKSLSFSASDATLSFDADSYILGSYASVTLVDAERNTSINVAQTLLSDVIIQTSSSNSTEVRMVETGADTGTFKGSIQVTSSGGTTEFSRIQASDGDKLTITYFDEVHTEEFLGMVTDRASVGTTAATPTPTAWPTVTVTATQTPTPTPTPPPPQTPTPIPSPTPTVWPTVVPTPTPTPQPPTTPTPTPIPIPSPTPTVWPTVAATPTPIPTEPLIQAIVDIQNKTINLDSTGSFFAKIRLPSGYDIDNIRCESIECEGAQASECQNDKKYLKVYFNIQDMDDLDMDANETKTMELTVTGELMDGTPFTGSDKAQVRRSDGTGWINGKVSSDNGPLEGATVTIKNKFFKDETITDAFGDYSFVNLAWGRHNVTAEKEGYTKQALAPKLSEKHNYRYTPFTLQKKK